MSRKLIGYRHSSAFKIILQRSHNTLVLIRHETSRQTLLPSSSSPTNASSISSLAVTFQAFSSQGSLEISYLIFLLFLFLESLGFIFQNTNDNNIPFRSWPTAKRRRLDRPFHTLNARRMQELLYTVSTRSLRDDVTNVAIDDVVLCSSKQ